jgi:flagellar biosynthesis/type III secretory pathway protein FliH
LPASSHRKSRSPGFLARLPSKGVHALFSDAGGDAELMFGAVEEAGPAQGVESLAPPLPPPPAHMTAENAERLGRAIELLRLTTERVGASVAANALEIGVMIARRILEAELKSDIEVQRALIRSAVRRLGETHKVTIHVAPADLEAVKAAAGEGHAGDLGLNLRIAKIEILPDTNLTPGDCLVDSDAASVDGRLGTRLEEIRRVLAGILHDDGNETP